MDSSQTFKGRTCDATTQDSLVPHPDYGKNRFLVMPCLQTQAAGCDQLMSHFFVKTYFADRKLPAKLQELHFFSQL